MIALYGDGVDPIAITVQGIITILAVAVGALGTYLATQGVERARWEREHTTRWDERKLEVYTDYAASVKMARLAVTYAPINAPLTTSPIGEEDMRLHMKAGRAK